jgi:hypothetical protein
MDPRKNPYAPGAGSPPPELAGRARILDDAGIMLHRLKEGRPARSNILVGLRGVGKTVLLNRIQLLADAEKYRTIFVEAHEGKSLPALLAPRLRQVLFALSAGEKAKRGMRVLKSFLGSLRGKASVGDIELEIGIEPERGVGDSGDLEFDLSEVFIAVGEAAAERREAIALCMDELQYLNTTELSALIMAMHRISQKALPFVLVGAGLPQIVGLTGKSKSYAERLFEFPQIGALKPSDAEEALDAPAKVHGVSFAPDAMDEILRVTEGYPYFLQQWGAETWNISAGPEITLQDVRAASSIALKRLDESFFRVRFDRLTPKEKEYLRALAKLGRGPQRSGEIADELGMSVQSVAPLRNGLIKKGMIYSPAHGDTEFTVPLFDQFLCRVMPKS